MKKKVTLMMMLAVVFTALWGCSSSGNGNDKQDQTQITDSTKQEEKPQEKTSEAPSEKITLKLGTTGATTGSIYKASTYFADAVAEVSGSALEIEVIGAGSLGTTAQHYAQLREGSLDIFITALDTGTTMQGGEDFAVCVVPYLFKDREHFAKFMESDVLQQMMDAVSGPNNIHYLGAMGFNLPRGLGCKFPVHSVEDVANLKIRVPETASMMTVWKAWGANPQIIASKELYTALEGGMVDAQENDLMTSFNNGWMEIAKYYMELEYIQQGNILYVSQDTWNRLSDQQKAWLEEGRIKAHEIFNHEMEGLYDTVKNEALESGVEFIDCDTQGFRQKAAQAAEEMDGDLWSDGLYQKISDLASE